MFTHYHACYEDLSHIFFHACLRAHMNIQIDEHNARRRRMRTHCVLGYIMSAIAAIDGVGVGYACPIRGNETARQ